jgi:hypothetical protein
MMISLIDRLAAAESRMRRMRFLAPCVRGGTVRTRVDGLVYAFRREPKAFEGWGVFAAESASLARLVAEAEPELIDAYLALFPSARLRLAYRLAGASWLAYPESESDARPRRRPAPVAVHLVDGAGAFDCVVAGWDGSSWWFADLDRAADPVITDAMRAEHAAGTDPGALRIRGLTPEMGVVYDLVARRDGGRSDERRLRAALGRGGGALRGFQDRDAFWLVEWSARDGSCHTTAVAKRDLTVISAGICLSGRDSEFDLQSLVGVVEDRPGWMRGMMR